MSKILQPHQQRVVEEHNELETKIQLLHKFSTSEVYKALPNDEKDRLRRQYEHMVNYANVLSERIDCF